MNANPNELKYMLKYVMPAASVHKRDLYPTEAAWVIHHPSTEGMGIISIHGDYYPSDKSFIHSLHKLFERDM